MSKEIWFFLTLGLLASGAHADALSDLTGRVDALEKKVATLQVVQTGTFTCAATCVLWEQGYQDTTSTVSSQGADRLAAYRALEEACVATNSPKYAHWFLKNPRTGASALATENNICVRD